MEKDKKKGSPSTVYLSSQFQKIVVETDEPNPVIVAEITKDDVESAPGYRFRLKPKAN